MSWRAAVTPIGKDMDLNVQDGRCPVYTGTPRQQFEGCRLGVPSAEAGFLPAGDRNSDFCQLMSELIICETACWSIFTSDSDNGMCEGAGNGQCLPRAAFPHCLQALPFPKPSAKAGVIS